jgi:hypothetical protein
MSTWKQQAASDIVFAHNALQATFCSSGFDGGRIPATFTIVIAIVEVKNIACHTPCFQYISNIVNAHCNWKIAR